MYGVLCRDGQKHGRIGALTDRVDPGLYWCVLKKRLKAEGNDTVTKCNTFKLAAKDGKLRSTPIADQEQLFRLIQSIPSPKAEPATYRENVTVTKKGGSVAKAARQQLESQLGRSVISDSNSSTLRTENTPPEEQ